MTFKGPEVECVVCRTAEDLAQALPAWRQFATQDGVACGFWCEPAVIGEMAGFGGGDALLLALVSVGRDLVAVLPFKMHEGPVPVFVGLWRVGALRVRSLRLYDYEFAVRMGQARPEILARVLAAFREQEAADVVVADNCVVDDERLWQRAGVAVRNKQPTYLVDMPSDLDVYLAGLRANTRQTLRRRMRKMDKEAGGALGARCFRAEQDMKELQGHLSAIWKQSWHGRLNRQPPPGLSFLKNMARAGWVRSFVLFAGEVPVASVLGFQYKGKFLDEAPAYDHRWMAFSPGLVLNYFILEDLFRTDSPRTVDFGFGYNQYKEMLGNRREQRCQLWMPVTRRGRVLLTAMRGCDAVYGLGKRIPAGARVIRGLKSRLRRHGVLR